MEICRNELCNGCTACANICPKSCITMIADDEGFLRPRIDEDSCLNCGKCRNICPVSKEKRAGTATVAYAAVNTDDSVRRNSTSGGVFTLLCQWVLERNGVVFGAAYNEDFEVVHCRVENLSDVCKLRGAKYAQSRLGDSFKQVEIALKEDKYALFSGTPCQIGGLISYLGKEYEKLILVDLICHGVPSPKVWKHYVEYRSKQDNDGVLPKSINLRSKETGWPRYSIRFEYPDKVYSALNSQDPYLRGFVGDLYLRPSCYDCRFKGISRQSDFTLGDYWGVWNQVPELNDGKGTSLVFVHSEKAKKLLEDIDKSIKLVKVEADDSIKENPSAIASSRLSEGRESFFAEYKTEDFSSLIDELRPIPVVTEHKENLVKRFLRRVKNKIVSILK